MNKKLKYMKTFEDKSSELNISDVIVRFLNSKAEEFGMNPNDIRIGIDYAQIIKQDRLYLFDNDGNRLDSLDINEL